MIQIGFNQPILQISKYLVQFGSKPSPCCPPIKNRREEGRGEKRGREKGRVRKELRGGKG
jgi:hypothetical protein